MNFLVPCNKTVHSSGLLVASKSNLVKDSDAVYTKTLRGANPL